MGLFNKLFGAGNNDQSSVIGHALTVLGGFLMVLPTMPGGAEFIQGTIGQLNPVAGTLLGFFLTYIGAAKAVQTPTDAK
jgi:hypothetical protein